MSSGTTAQVVFTEIPVEDPARARAFYEALLDGELTEELNGPNPIWMFPSDEDGHSAGHLYPGTPARNGAGMTAHFVVGDDLDLAMGRVRRGGGTVVSLVLDLDIGSFFYAIDTEGNSLGLFKYKS